MKKIVFGFLCILPYIIADVIAKPTPPIMRPPKPEHPIVRPPLRPIAVPVYVQEEYNNYTNVVTSCNEYIRIIEEKNQEIMDLKREIESLKNKEQVTFQRNLKKEYEEKLKQFDERTSGLKRKNTIDISNK